MTMIFWLVVAGYFALFGPVAIEEAKGHLATIKFKLAIRKWNKEWTHD